MSRDVEQTSCNGAFARLRGRRRSRERKCGKRVPRLRPGQPLLIEIPMQRRRSAGRQKKVLGGGRLVDVGDYKPQSARVDGDATQQCRRERGSMGARVKNRVQPGLPAASWIVMCPSCNGNRRWIREYREARKTGHGGAVPVAPYQSVLPRSLFAAVAVTLLSIALSQMLDIKFGAGTRY